MKFEMSKATGLAGLVHLLTASGALCALFALEAIFQSNAKTALLWLLLALIIDGVDGPLARTFKVSEAMPQIDGEMLDLIVDFLNYVFVPVVFVWHFEMFPVAAQNWLFVGILFSSLYLFVYTDMKGQDNYFNGFPAAWNLVLIIWFIIGTSPLVNAATTIILCVLTFVPIKSVHPVRVARLNGLNVALVTLWILLSGVLVVTIGETQVLLTTVWSAATLYFVGFSFWRTLMG
jgi:phosphatidylcholine synthase